MEDDSSHLPEVLELFSDVTLPLKVDKLIKVSSGDDLASLSGLLPPFCKTREGSLLQMISFARTHTHVHTHAHTHARAHTHTHAHAHTHMHAHARTCTHTHTHTCTHTHAHNTHAHNTHTHTQVSSSWREKVRSTSSVASEQKEKTRREEDAEGEKRGEEAGEAEKGEEKIGGEEKMTERTDDETARDERTGGETGEKKVGEETQGVGMEGDDKSVTPEGSENPKEEDEKKREVSQVYTASHIVFCVCDKKLPPSPSSVLPSLPLPCPSLPPSFPPFPPSLPQALYESGLRSLVELTSVSIELFRKMAEVSLLPDVSTVQGVECLTVELY